MMMAMMMTMRCDACPLPLFHSLTPTTAIGALPCGSRFIPTLFFAKKISIAFRVFPILLHFDC